MTPKAVTMQIKLTPNSVIFKVWSSGVIGAGTWKKRIPMQAPTNKDYREAEAEMKREGWRRAHD